MFQLVPNMIFYCDCECILLPKISFHHWENLDWYLMVTPILLNIGSENGLLPDGTEPLLN